MLQRNNTNNENSSHNALGTYSVSKCCTHIISFNPLNKSSQVLSSPFLRQENTGGRLHRVPQTVRKQGVVVRKGKILLILF